jgi:hypothetical protein
VLASPVQLLVVLLEEVEVLLVEDGVEVLVVEDTVVVLVVLLDEVEVLLVEDATVVLVLVEGTVLVVIGPPQLARHVSCSSRQMAASSCFTDMHACTHAERPLPGGQLWRHSGRSRDPSRKHRPSSLPQSPGQPCEACTWAVRLVAHAALQAPASVRHPVRPDRLVTRQSRRHAPIPAEP